CSVSGAVAGTRWGSLSQHSWYESSLGVAGPRQVTENFLTLLAGTRSGSLGLAQRA
ncbi:hypothetical protein A2U01_0076359, partial [Trifolium medium]|nr:hypothetical protein [Trifolium medium]